MAKELTIEQIDAQIAALQTQRELLKTSTKEKKQKEAMAQIAEIKDQIDQLFIKMEVIAKDAGIDYISYDGPSYGMGGYWSESSGWESSSSSC